MIKRDILESIVEDIGKIIIIIGPRQAGKTFLSKQISKNYLYLNYDSTKDRLLINAEEFSRDADLIIFDELHKKKDWKQWIKGIYDTESLNILVTGSARLNIFRRIEESLAGRHYLYRLFPLDLAELKKDDPKIDVQKTMDQLLITGGFPEPFLSGTLRGYKKWSQTYLDSIIRYDLVDIVSINDIKAMELLIELLKLNVGSTVSYANLARKIEKDPRTVKNWITILESLFIIFKVSPYSKNINRSILKEAKYYFYDWASLENEGAKLENFVAFSLFKRSKYIEDMFYNKSSVHFIKDKEGREVDFLFINDTKETLIEVKSTDHNLSRSLAYFSDKFSPETKKIQLVKSITKERFIKEKNIKILNMGKWLSSQ